MSFIVGSSWVGGMSLEKAALQLKKNYEEEIVGKLSTMRKSLLQIWQFPHNSIKVLIKVTEKVKGT